MSRQPSDPTAILIVVSTLPAAGKSTIARRLAQQFHAADVRIDTIGRAVAIAFADHSVVALFRTHPEKEEPEAVNAIAQAFLKHGLQA